MTQPQQNIKTLDYVSEFAALEDEISKTISPAVLDYVFILDPNREEEKIQLTTPLTSSQMDLLSRYNNLALKYLDEINLEIELPQGDLFNKYIEISRNIYLIRFVEARKLFAEYALFVIPTSTSIDLAGEYTPDLEPEISMEIKIPDSLIINDDGSFNLEETIKKETESDSIKSTLSSYSNLFYLSHKSIRDLTNITTRAFLVGMNQEFLLELMQTILQIIIIEIDKHVYDYIKKGYNPIDAVKNVSSLLEKVTKKTGTEFPDMLSHLQKEIEQIIDENLEQQIKLEKEILKDLSDEILELLVHYCSQGKILSDNYYLLRFIPHYELEENYRDYHNVIEVFLYDDYGKTTPQANEAYDIDFSRDFKQNLFSLVTNDIENPNLTLEEYLYRI